jgi:hypothetical protein
MQFLLAYYPMWDIRQQDLDLSPRIRKNLVRIEHVLALSIVLAGGICKFSSPRVSELWS